MHLHTDHTFRIGTHHQHQGLPCQDYARSGTLDTGGSYAIVSDGCSSGGNTDIGARLITLSMEQALRDGFGGSLELITQRMHGYLGATQRLLAVKDRDLLATLLTAVVHPSGVACVSLLGDGVIAYADDDVGDIFALKVEWADNMPFYPAYHGTLRDQFCAHHRENAAAVTVEEWRITPTPYQYKNRTRTYSAFSGMDGIIWCHDATRGPENDGHRSIGLFSDGVLQVDGYSWQEVVGALMTFKQARGSFARRRMNRFLLDAKKRGTGPFDDIAMAVIHLEK